MNSQIDTRTVRALGVRDGITRATWGQSYMIERVSWLGRNQASSNILVSITLPPGRFLQDVEQVISTVAGENETLRTRFSARDDGGFDQIVSRYSDVSFYVCDLPEAGGEKDECLENLRMIPFELDEDFPFRVMCFLRAQDSSVAELALIVSHVSADGWSLDLLTRQIKSHLRSGGTDAVPGPGAVRQPLDQALYEQGSTAQKGSAQAIEYWRAQVGSMSSAVPGIGSHSGDRWEFGHAPAGELLRASRDVGRQTGVSASSILMTAYALLIARTTGATNPTIVSRISNRVDRAMTGYVGQLHQEVPISVDVSGCTLRALARKVFSQGLKAYRYGAYNPLDLTAALGEMMSIEQRLSRLGYVYNFVDNTDQREPGGAELSGVTWLTGLNFDISHLYFATGGNGPIEILVDRMVASPPSVARAFSDVESLLVRASNDVSLLDDKIVLAELLHS